MSAVKDPALNDCDKALELVRKIRDESIGNIRSESQKNLESIGKLNMWRSGTKDDLLETEVLKRNAYEKTIQENYAHSVKRIVKKCTAFNNDSEHFLK